MIEGLIAMSIVGLVFIIPTLVFKNGTAFNIEKNENPTPIEEIEW